MDALVIRDWYQGYLDAFAATVNDLSKRGGMLKFYGVPLILAGDDEAQVLTSEDDVLAFVQSAASGLRSEDYSHSQLLDSRLIDINGSTVLLRTDFSRRRTDGSEIQQLGATYLIARGVSGLRIFAVGIHSPATVERLVTDDPE
jgi:hypothetical protein